jgi:hypothetical protein
MSAGSRFLDERQGAFSMSGRARFLDERQGALSR